MSKEERVWRQWVKNTAQSRARSMLIARHRDEYRELYDAESAALIERGDLPTDPGDPQRYG